MFDQEHMTRKNARALHREKIKFKHSSKMTLLLCSTIDEGVHVFSYS
jgi:hypothetical protein